MSIRSLVRFQLVGSADSRVICPTGQSVGPYFNGWSPKLRVHELVGQLNLAKVEIANKLSTALLDTGSMISTVDSHYYYSFLSSFPLYPLDDLLEVRLAGGHRLCYTGYIEVPFHIPFSNFYISALFLVVPSSTVSTNVHFIIGTNILDRIPDEDVKALNSAWRAAVSVFGRQKNGTDKIYPLRTFRSVKIAPNSSTCISCSVNVPSPFPGRYYFVSDDISTPSSLQVLPGIFENGSSTQSTKRFKVKVQNTSNKYVTIPEFNLDDLSNRFSKAEQDQLRELLCKYKDIFAKTDLELGKTDLIQHEIHLSDESTFKERHRRIPPSMYQESL
ncbi:hypothetical protein LOTGIDRAFT_162047 [Lottia gigantea]|uniref:Peptidase A2 domain-containing protein n=1 Tax=Lottia gigantea TaxID=225164 RepID=V3ZNS2_LOTGI|nr:hypothetical protein LOTGIDRAFT_162047 [Lottia gigantea]ESO93023.1 hypothetical protein LOTGIDRAFT_162047 [Lottia gigantea]